MRVVIDTNRLESDELDLFLRGSADNLAVLPEHTVVEIFKIRDVDAVIGSFRILRKYPRQVLLLRNNRFARAVDPRAGVAAIANSLIDRTITREFVEFCGMLDRSEAGDASLRRQLITRQRWAAERADAVEQAFGDQSEALKVLRTQFRKDDIRRLGAREPLSIHARGIILSGTRMLAKEILPREFQWVARMRTPMICQHFTWRYCLCHLLQLVRMMGLGATRRAPAKARNDHFDNVFATYATYYNGLMSMDAETNLTQSVARLILTSLGAYVSTDYLESGYILKVIEREGATT